MNLSSGARITAEGRKKKNAGGRKDKNAGGRKICAEGRKGKRA
jgi:hypothetical protein